MRLPLDQEDRFWLTARDEGWELEIDGKTTWYCLSPVEALQYLGAKLREESRAQGLDQVLAALARIETAIEHAAAKILEKRP